MDTLERIEQVQEGKPGIKSARPRRRHREEHRDALLQRRAIRWIASVTRLEQPWPTKCVGIWPVDLCPRHLAMYVGDINDLDLLGLKEEAYDVILLSLVLSSMPRMPDFATIAGLLAPRGSLIISDISPDYTQAHPYYEVRGGRQQHGRDAHETCAALLGDALQRLNSAGLKLTELTSIRKGCPLYSFNATFTSAARPSTKMAATRTTGCPGCSTVCLPSASRLSLRLAMTRV